jgi:hypothetical protein
MSHHPYASSAVLLSLVASATWLLCSADVLSHIAPYFH